MCFSRHIEKWVASLFSWWKTDSVFNSKSVTSLQRGQSVSPHRTNWNYPGDVLTMPGFTGHKQGRERFSEQQIFGPMKKGVAPWKSKECVNFSDRQCVYISFISFYTLLQVHFRLQLMSVSLPGMRTTSPGRPSITYCITGAHRITTRPTSLLQLWRTWTEK